MQRVTPANRDGSRLTRIVAMSVAVTVIGTLTVLAETQAQGTAVEAAVKPDLSWRQTETSIALLNHGRRVWECVHDSKIGKPYMRIGLLDGTELTRPWPIPPGYPKDDHTWHRALWWSWKFINGHNFWEENQQGTDPTQIEVTHTPAGDAQINITIMYHLPDQAPVLKEERGIHISQPDQGGCYFIDWQTRFTPAGTEAVTFSNYRYGGLSLRMAAELSETPAWVFLANTEEVTANGTSVPTRWMAYQGTLARDQNAALAIFDHPDNPRYPTTWLVRDNYPYMNPTFPGNQDYTLRANENLSLRYGILVYQGTLTKRQIERHWKRFARDKTAKMDPVRFDPVVQQAQGLTVPIDP